MFSIKLPKNYAVMEDRGDTEGESSQAFTNDLAGAIPRASLSKEPCLLS